MPLVLVIYLFRKKILNYFLKKIFLINFIALQTKGGFYNIYENNNKDYIEVDYEKNKEEDNKINYY